MVHFSNVDLGYIVQTLKSRRILGIFRPFSVTNERPEISALFPGKRADFSFSAWAVGGGRRADFTEGQKFYSSKKMCVSQEKLDHIGANAVIRSIAD